MKITFPANDRRVSITAHSPEAAESEDGVFTATIQWTLVVKVVDNPYLMLPDWVASLFIAYLPVRGTRYHNLRPWVTCRTTKGAQVKGGVYSFTATYSDKNSFEEEPGEEENPLNDRAKVLPVALVKNRAVYRDRDDNAILNSAKDPVIQTMDENQIGFKIKKNVASVPSWVFTHTNTCNSNGISVEGLPLPANSARLIFPSDWWSEPKSRNEITYYVISFELLIDFRDLHYGWPLDAGFRELVEGKQVAIVSSDGSEPSSPVPLNGDGTRMTAPTPETVRYLEIKKYPEVNYSILPGVN